MQRAILANVADKIRVCLRNPHIRQIQVPWNKLRRLMKAIISRVRFEIVSQRKLLIRKMLQTRIFDCTWAGSKFPEKLANKVALRKPSFLVLDFLLYLN
jgi:hypothetical protein